MFDQLERHERLLLLKFVCAFAWADLEVQDEERSFVRRLVRKLKLAGEERQQVEEWLEHPPRPEEIDPNAVPRRHRQLFLDVARETIASDGEIAPEEAENYELFKQLLG